MKNRKHLILFGVVLLGFILGTIALNSQNNQGDKNEAQTDRLNQPSKDIDSITLKTSGAWELSNITIDDAGWTIGALTWDQAKGQPWCSGEGTWAKPYLIENVTINATNSPTRCGIIIKYSDKPFIIRNCTVYNSAAAGPHDAGIKLENTNNGNLTNNNCSNNQRTGILLYNDCYNNTISGNTVNNNGAFGIYLYQVENNTISNNLVNDNGDHGILDYYGNENTVFNNSINSNGNTKYGISLSFCENTELSGNEMKNCGIVLTGETSTVNSHTIFTNNTVNGKPVYYYADENDLGSANFTHAGEPGQIILAKCRDSIISSFNLSYSSVGIELTFSENITVSNNTVNYNSLCGIYLHGQCNDNTIFNNTANGGSIFNRGIILEFYCSNNNITGNTITDNGLWSGYAGLYLSNSDYNNITENTLESNYDGIYLRNSSFNIIRNNTVNDNENVGIHLYDNCDSNDIINNTGIDTPNPKKLKDGIRLEDGCDGNMIQGNYFQENEWNGISLLESCDDNRIFDNILYNNSLNGIFLNDNCVYNKIGGNSATFNDEAGIYLLDSDHNSIIENTAKNNTYGLIFEDSSYNCVYGNTLVNNTYNYKEIGNSNLNRDCRKLIPPAPDDDDDDDETGIVIVIIIIVVLACIGAGGAIVFILIKKRHNRRIQT